MLVKVQKWRNSLVVLLPKVLADECGIEAHSSVEVSREEKRIVMKPVRSKPSLTNLLAQITEDNLHSAVEAGSAVGRESW